MAKQKQISSKMTLDDLAEVLNYWMNRILDDPTEWNKYYKEATKKSH